MSEELTIEQLKERGYYIQDLNTEDLRVRGQNLVLWKRSGEIAGEMKRDWNEAHLWDYARSLERNRVDGVAPEVSLERVEYSMPATAMFAARPGEVFHLSDTPRDQAPSYAVMLHKVPDFPGNKHPESSSLTVLCAGQYTTEKGVLDGARAWGWVHLENDTKQLIGYALQSMNAPLDKWFYLYISGGIGHRSESHMQAVMAND